MFLTWTEWFTRYVQICLVRDGAPWNEDVTWKGTFLLSRKTSHWASGGGRGRPRIPEDIVKTQFKEKLLHPLMVLEITYMFLPHRGRPWWRLAQEILWYPVSCRGTWGWCRDGTCCRPAARRGRPSGEEAPYSAEKRWNKAQEGRKEGTKAGGIILITGTICTHNY